MTASDYVHKDVVPFRVGQWLPSDQAVLDQWLAEHIAEAEAKAKPLCPVLEDLKALIESDPEIYMLFTKMFEQVPKRPPYLRTPTSKPQVHSYQQMLRVINHIMSHAPTFNESGLVGFPINAVLDWPMGTPAGTSAFLNAKVNAQLKKILDEWGQFLQSPESAYVLSDYSPKHWFSAPALEALASADPFRGQGSDPWDPKENFIYSFKKCDPAKPHWGFESWDDFFTREFHDDRRPVASPDDGSVIANACESAPYRIAYGVQWSDTFWIKSQPYSLRHMLADDPLAQQLVGGTIYQAFLSAKSYHRWHCPVDGTIVKAYVTNGSYYAEALSEGFDPSGPNESQGYITAVATRALIFIEADNPDIGLMCVMPVGMAEVSSCDITDIKKRLAAEGKVKIKKGDPLGTFHFGGSTHCLFFRPGVRLAFDLHGQSPGLDSSNIPVKARLATVCK